MLIREWFGTNTIMSLQNKSNQKKQTYQNIPYDHICLEGHCGNTAHEPLGGSMSQHLNSPNENQAINHYTLSIHQQHIIKWMECEPVNIISSSTSYSLPLLPSFILLGFFFILSLSLSLSLSVSCVSYLVLLHQAVLLLLWGRLPGYQNSCAVVSASRYGDPPGSGAGRCDNRHERDVTHTLQYTRVFCMCIYTFLTP